MVSLDSVYGGKRSFDAHLAYGGVQRGIPQRLSTRWKGTFSARLGRASCEVRNAQRSRITPSRAGPSPQGITCGAPARTSRSIWTEPALSCRNSLSVRHFASDRVPSDVRRLTRSASVQLHIVALSYTLSRDTTHNQRDERK